MNWKLRHLSIITFITEKLHGIDKYFHHTFVNGYVRLALVTVLTTATYGESMHGGDWWAVARTLSISYNWSS
jgi:hypothetical protein